MQPSGDKSFGFLEALDKVVKKSKYFIKNHFVAGSAAIATAVTLKSHQKTQGKSW